MSLLPGVDLPSALSAPVRMAGAVASAPLRVTAAVAESAAQVPGKVLVTAAGAARAAAQVAAEAVGVKPIRRVNRIGEDVWIEVRGLVENFDVLAPQLHDVLGAIPGVTEVHVNGPLSRVMVTVAAGGPGVDELSRVVADVENTESSGPEPRLPGDESGLLMNLVGTGVALGATAAAAVGAVVPLKGMSRMLVAPLTAAEYQPELRAFLDRRLGDQGAALLLRALSSAASVFTNAPAAALVGAVLGAVETTETLNASRAWADVGPRLAEEARKTPTVAPPLQDPLPPLEVNRRFKRLSTHSGLAAAAVFGIAGRAETAAEAATVGAPKAHRSVMESFAAAVEVPLTAKHGALVMNPRALRGLSEVDTLLVDPRALFTDEVRVARVSGGADPVARTAAWHRAGEELAAGNLSRGWNTLGDGDGDGDGEIRVLVSPARDPLASALLMEARRTGLTVVSLADDGYGSFHQAFDDLYPNEADVDAGLARVARQLAGDERKVMLFTRSGVNGPAAVPLSIALLDDDLPTAWNADVLVPGLDGAWRLIHAIPAAREAARRGLALSAGASVLGGLMLIPGVMGSGPGTVNTSALYGFWSGYSIARRVFTAPVPDGDVDEDWHAMPVSEVARRLPPPTRDESASALAAVAVDGPLSVLGGARDYLRDFVATMREDLNDPITPILATGATATALLGSPLDAGMVGGVLALNTALSAQQSLHAERLLAGMLAVADPAARRISGFSDHTEFEELPAGRLLPGDLIEVRSGEVVPADARIIDVDNAEVDESALTGESLPVAKTVDETPGAPLAERTGMLFAGTTMVAGRARAIVTGVGPNTAAARALAISPRPSRDVGLGAQLGDITSRALPWSFTGGALIGLFSLLRGTPIRDTAQGTVSIAVAAVPEGLPLVVTLAQSASARRLMGSKVLVRNSRAIEAFARLGAVCFDKTGTLSENRLRVVKVVPLRDNTEADVLRVAGETMLVRRDGTLEHSTDSAIHDAALEAGVEFITPDALLPFQSDRPYAAALLGGRVLVKGAPEAVAAALDESESAVLHEALEQMAARGLRVLAVAERDVDAEEATAAEADPAVLEQLAGTLRLTGLVGLADTPRAGALPLIEELVSRDIEVRMITGDHPVTAAAVATDLGLDCRADEVMTGDVWDTLTTTERSQAARRYKVFARMAPEHKVQVVQALEAAGLITAMVGDGANDAAAIRAASVGVGVASTGSDPARIAADVMLLDGDILSILDALEEGEQLWRRVLSAVSVLLGHSIGEVTFGLLSTMITGRPALNARQMMLVNMLTDALPAAALAVSPQRDPDVKGAHDESTIWRAVAVRAAFTTLGAVLAWSMASVTGRRERASTVGLVGLVGSQMLEMLSDSNGRLVIGTSLGTFAVMAAIISTPGLSHLFGCTPLGPVGWGQAIGAAFIAAGVAKLLPGVVDKIADELPNFLERFQAAPEA